jgi:GNAT superfamily N-acetyltransferase
LARLSSGARLVHSAAATAAVFPAWLPLNNAILLESDDGAAAAATSELMGVYAGAGVKAWALWVPSAVTNLDDPDAVQRVGGFRRDTTTLVMQASLPPGLRLHDGVVPASIADAARAGDEPFPITDLEEPDIAPGVAGWVMAHGGLAVAGAWSLLHEKDCGIYAVGTVPGWRRRGLARNLVEHLLADARRHGAQTATLQSTRMAQQLYQSLGFEPAGRYEEWVSG